MIEVTVKTSKDILTFFNSMRQLSFRLLTQGNKVTLLKSCKSIIFLLSLRDGGWQRCRWRRRRSWTWRAAPDNRCGQLRTRALDKSSIDLGCSRSRTENQNKILISHPEDQKTKIISPITYHLLIWYFI